MFKNRFLLVIGIVSLLLVTLAISRPFFEAPSAEARPYVIDSATRSYIAWGKAMQARNAIDSATRSYIAWGKALQAAGKLGDSGACSNTSQENIFAGIPDNVDSATRSYIAWGLALQSMADTRGSCR